MRDKKHTRGSVAKNLRDGAGGNTGKLEKTIQERLEYPHHRQMLIEQLGISAMVAAERGYHTVKTKTELARLGFSERQRRAPALVIPMYSPAGELVAHQIRPDSPREDGNGKAIRYETPASSRIRLDVHPSQTERVKDASIPCGSRKA